MISPTSLSRASTGTTGVIGSSCATTPVSFCLFHPACAIAERTA
jgi:hypothetical protein